MKKIPQILTLLVVINVAMSSTIETLVSETSEVSTKNAIYTSETEIFTESITMKPSDLQPDAVDKYISTMSPITSDVEVPTKPTELQSETIVEDVTTKISTISLELMKDISRDRAEVQQTESSHSNIAIEKQLPEVSTKSPEGQTELLIEESSTNKTANVTLILMEESSTKPSVTLEDYAVKEMVFILDHILIVSQEFVSKVLEATGNSLFQRDYLKRYAENLHFLLNPEDLTDDYSDEIDLRMQVQKQPEDPYKSVLKKLAFLKGKSTKQLQEHLPVDWIKAYKSNKQDVSIWLDKASEQLRTEFNKYISDETDHVKYQYFNEAFDDIPRATEIHQKLAIIVDLIKIVKNEKQITFMDLYMQ